MNKIGNPWLLGLVISLVSVACSTSPVGDDGNPRAAEDIASSSDAVVWAQSDGGERHAAPAPPAVCPEVVAAELAPCPKIGLRCEWEDECGRTTAICNKHRMFEVTKSTNASCARPSAAK